LFWPKQSSLALIGIKAALECLGAVLDGTETALAYGKADALSMLQTCMEMPAVWDAAACKVMLDILTSEQQLVEQQHHLPLLLQFFACRKLTSTPHDKALAAPLARVLETYASDSGMRDAVAGFLTGNTGSGINASTWNLLLALIACTTVPKPAAAESSPSAASSSSMSLPAGVSADESTAVTPNLRAAADPVAAAPTAEVAAPVQFLDLSTTDPAAVALTTPAAAVAAVPAAVAAVPAAVVAPPAAVAAAPVAAAPAAPVADLSPTAGTAAVVAAPAAVAAAPVAAATAPAVALTTPAAPAVAAPGFLDLSSSTTPQVAPIDPREPVPPLPTIATIATAIAVPDSTAPTFLDLSAPAPSRCRVEAEAEAETEEFFLSLLHCCCCE
jgi:hypothetical protein